MRIGLVSLHTSPLETPGQHDAGGMNVVVRESALALEALGHEVSIATRASSQVPPGYRPLTAGSSVQVHAFEVGKPGLAKSDLPAIVPDFARILATHPSFRDADVLHAHYWLSGVAALTSGTALGIPVVTTMHTVGAQKNAYLAPGDTPEPQERIAGEQLLTQSSRIVAGSASELNAVISSYGIPEKGSTVIHPGVDTTLFRPAEPPSHADGLTFLVLGRVQPLKGQDLALEAFARFTEDFPYLARGSTLTIAGQPTPGQEPFAAALRARAQALGLPVTFLSAQTRIESARLLRESDVVIMPSHSETFGLVSLEAAASGTPVVASRTTGLRESVSEGESGVLVTGRDPRGWAEAIAALVSSPETLMETGQRARTFAVRHDWAMHARSLEQVYQLRHNPSHMCTVI